LEGCGLAPAQLVTENSQEFFARVDSDGTLPAAARFVTVGIQGFFNVAEAALFLSFSELVEALQFHSTT
jgi:hypothetical protein